MASFATRFLAAALAKGNLAEYLKFGKMEHVFALDPGAADTFQFVKHYIEKEGALPPAHLVEAETQTALPVEDVGLNWLYEKAFDTYVQRSLKIAVKEANELFDQPLEALSALSKALDAVRLAQLGPKIVDFKNAYSDSYPQMVQKWAMMDSVAKFGWHYMDHQSGGIWPGDLISLVGRPGLGKTWLMLWVALNVWKITGQPVVFVSMEIMAQKIVERLAALYTGTAMDFFKTGMAPTMFTGDKKLPTKKKVQTMLKELEGSDMPPFIVVDGNLTAAVTDVVSVVQQFKPGAVFIDGAYMLQNGQTKSLYEAVAVNCNLLKQRVATDLGCPTFCSWQFSRELEKLKKGQKPGLEHIGYSDVIGQVSTIVLGLFQDDDQSNVESLYHRKISVLKGRDGEVGEFLVHWDFKRMVFAEVDKSAIAAGEIAFFD